jgi:hypothetical protein
MFRRDQLTMDYFDNLDNESLKKYKKNLKKNYRCVLLLLFKFHVISLSFDCLSKTIKFSYNLQRLQFDDF